MKTAESEPIPTTIEGLQKELRRARAQRDFLSRCLAAGDPTPCKNCGRIVLAGRCCDKPDIDPPVPGGVPVEDYEKVLRQLHALEDLFEERLKKSGRSEDDLDWVRETFVQGFVPSISNDKARREAAEARSEADQWCSFIIRLRTHLRIPHDATHNDVPELAAKALRDAQEDGARWMAEAAGVTAIDPKVLVQARRGDYEVVYPHPAPAKKPPKAKTKKRKKG